MKAAPAEAWTVSHAQALRDWLSARLGPWDGPFVVERCRGGQSNPSYRLQGGDAVVIESHEQLLKLHTHSDHFALLREVVDSKPPITGEFMDR